MAKLTTAEIKKTITELCLQLPRTDRARLEATCNLAWYQARQQTTARGRTRAHDDVVYSRGLLAVEQRA